MTERDGDIVRNQLTEGNRGAQGYFMGRIDMMLESERSAEQLHAFMRNWWPSFKQGLDARRAHGEHVTGGKDG